MQTYQNNKAKGRASVDLGMFSIDELFFTNMIFKFTYGTPSVFNVGPFFRVPTFKDDVH